MSLSFRKVAQTAVLAPAVFLGGQALSHAQESKVPQSPAVEDKNQEVTFLENLDKKATTTETVLLIGVVFLAGYGTWNVMLGEKILKKCEGIEAALQKLRVELGVAEKLDELAELSPEFRVALQKIVVELEKEPNIEADNEGAVIDVSSPQIKAAQERKAKLEKEWGLDT